MDTLIHIHRRGRKNTFYFPLCTFSSVDILIKTDEQQL